ncbi:hypothetical protein [Pseudobacteroides cellulosolvens]|uniref:Uncharacterized protein n=1 Tax=Pseudobacteroides cellulosolvens ATCC 35603 = DSM 2933 TaxID=398512 RepID=A0A0L6JNZ8_9FIRM|nr:hypothetical protein [Pseudobacteroides cellulosolvens]KNY27503.1 hypothetical protein Bccel_2774 [Pseudobacteroides cellulosolvens ATCC 35603 = DSM 2933]
MSKFEKDVEKNQIEDTSNRWLKILWKCQLWLAILSVPFNIILWIVAPDSGTRGSILGMTLGLIIMLFVGCLFLSPIKTIGTKLRKLKITLGICLFMLFFIGGIGLQTQIARDLLGGMQDRIGILEYYKDEGKVSKSNSNHNYKIKISTFEEELSVARPESFGAELDEYLHKEIRVHFYKGIKEIEDIYVQGSDEGNN